MTHYYNANHTAKTSALHRALLLAICFILSFTTPSLAQTIGGNVFGGGNQGDVNQSSTVELRGGIIEGNVFGGGNKAVVKKSTSVTISGGELRLNVYGAGNQGNVGSSSTVTLKGGTIKGDVYGGARMANVGEYSFVNIDGENATSSLIVKSVYGGNDIAGIIGNSTNAWTLPDDIKTKFSQEIVGNTFIYSSTNTQYPVIIGSLYGGGNGDYTYTAQDDKFNVAVGSETFEVENKPELNNTHIKLLGGIFGNIYGGGNNATVTSNTVIYMNNQLANLSVSEATLGDFKNLFDATDYSTENGNITFSHHVSRMFGGNNLATMSIRPTWNLIKGSINNLYSGGNRGAMTNKNGILLPLTSADLTVNNVYGGCRIADVNPGKSPDAETFNGHDFPEGYATRVYITAGSINNVYGGNDISGKVHYGTNLAIFSDIEGDVYGGGNGSYAYTDKVTISDYYYKPGDGKSSIEALFDFRPHIEKTLIHVAGNDAAPICLGNVYCGGNSATIYKEDGLGAATFRIGKNITIGNVFLGSNGENMVTETMLQQYADDNYNTIKLTEEDQFKSYMAGVAVNILPKIEWDNDLDHTTRIGSFFCGGNIGSMTYAGVAKTGNSNHFEFPAGITITDKIVAGCNNANITKVDNLNAAYEGGLVGATDDAGDKVRIKVLSRLEPTSTKTVSYQDAEGVLQENKPVYQGANVYGGCYESGMVNGNVVIDIESDIMAPNLDSNILTATGDYINASALAIYGGGYGADAVIKGNTTINLTNNARVLFVFGGGEMGKVTGSTTVKLAQGLKIKDGDNNYQNAYKVYAGGYAGPVGGNTTLNLLGGSVMSAFAGACNANIGGTTEVIIGAGTPGVPYVTHAVYGGNDFGGHIGVNNTSSKLYENITVPDGTKNVRTQTYVKYVSGKIGRAIYGGSYGSYEYTHAIYGNLADHTYPTIKTAITAQQNDPAETILTNTFVDIASTSNSSEDVIGSENSESVLTMLAGGGRGYKGLPEHVAVGQTYLLLHGASYAYRNNQLMAHRVYGGGNLSKVGNTRIDAYSGSFGAIFGGTHGVKTETANDLAASYDCVNTEINFYGGMDKADMNLYGTGANSGATRTATINLHGGKVNNVYGGSLAEGYTANTVVNVPKTSSNLQANALFGGALGEDEGRPCDVGVSNVTFASTSATVEDGIYGGNHTARATKETNVTISVPVYNQSSILQNIFGAGYGQHTVAGFTHIILNEGAEVARVYGGGREGKVYNHYKYIDNDNVNDNVNLFANYPTERYATWSTTGDALNTLIDIHGSSARIAHVTGNVYGAGYGAVAHTSGKTKVQLLGGTVDGDIYGGGEMGTMPLMNAQTNGFIANTSQVISTLCAIEGGQVRNVFGGGYQGRIEGNSGVSIGTTNPSTDTPFFDGVPTILRSAYGGGEMAEVTGTSTVDMYNGYIGYRYYPGAEENNKYQPELKLNADDEANLLSENGNLYGAGFGEGAVVMNTRVRLYGGTIRNGLYGGGEIASVGSKIQNNDGSYTYTYGQTNVYMYGGLVVGDVFGGGRGYSYDLTGNQIVGKTLYIDGYVFGKTNVEIYRGTIGTDESLALGHGNVFGGGNIGYVYSRGVKSNGGDGQIKGHYYHTGDDPYTADKTETTSDRTEDCRVHIAAGALVTANSVTINSHTYSKGEFVHNAVLNTLTYDADNPGAWASLDNEGVTIRNAVFAGGNVSAGSDKVYANAVTVFGNATAAVVDVFSRDLVTLGGEHVGGLYGDGNLTFVDGYRELNITNYGTDYYHLKNKDYSTVTSEREKAYYMYDDLNSRWVINSTSGRTMNTIQRADFCGVFGCRILLHGAQDRVPDVVDYTNYTINRVGEVSLNCVTKNSVTHGNYFGIYNVVNLLGAFTSDVEFSDVRTAKEDGTVDHKYDDDTNCNYGTATYSQFKSHYLNTDYRNDGKSHNMVALASGVYLELVKDYDSNGNKIYGPVTGVIELDLINVTTGEGGGYVYAKNEHGTANSITDEDQKEHLTLSDANEGAITQAAYTYGAANAQSLMQTSGNFVHPEKRIGDDCFPKGGDYREPVHFWYVCGTSYVYDQHISAYTGAARPYEQSINIPLTIANGSDGKIKLINITYNKYYTGATALKYGNKTYQPFDPITLKEYNELPDRHKTNFTDALYVAQCDVWTANGVKYSLEDKISQEQYTDLGTLYSDAGKTTTIRKEDAFCIGNEMSHENGYMLTFEMSNPKVWGAYYTPINGSLDKIKEEDYLKLTNDNKKNYIKAPTIRCNISGIYGQQSYQKEELVNQTVITKQNAIVNGEQAIKEAYALIQSTQAVFQEAYIAINNVYINGTTYIAGNYISKEQYESSTFENYRESFRPAYICVNTIEVADKEFLFPGDLISSDRYQELAGKTSTDDTYMAGISITDYFSPAYVCTKAGNYGGTYFKEGVNYDALDICELPKTERNKKVGQTSVFEFNHDALDLFDAYDAPYDEEQYVDFTAAYEYTGPTKTLYNKEYNDDGTYTGNVTPKTIQSGDILQREDFQLLLNEQAHYIPVDLAAEDNYIVKKELSIGNTTYHIGQTIKESDYTSLTEDQKNTYIHVIDTEAPETRYICFESYHEATINDSGASTQTETDNIVAEGTIIIKDAFDALPNSQEDFVITGLAAIETSTLFVPRGSDIRNLGVDRIVTVELEYKYKDRRPDFSFEEKLEKHIVNIHIQFKSGQPSIGEVIAPAVVLPNSTVGLSVPTVTPGAYEIIGGGWEIFKNETDAKNHKNGEPYINNATPMYWYQNDYYVAYFAKTYLGKAYSNPVPFTIANYHRLGEVMNHPEYMYIDHEEVKRAPKIYLDAAEYPNESIAAGKGEKNDLDYLVDLYNVTLQETTTNDAGQSVSVTIREVEERIKGGANLEFILRSDIAPKAAWTPVGTQDNPFAGTFHGNGYTISGLNNASLFGHLGGKVYNLGVNGGNVASTMANVGRIENVWVSATRPVRFSGTNVVNYHFLTDDNAASFAKGEVAYLLNSFHINKTDNNTSGYVEKYFADGDFIYAGGTIPLTTDVRYQNGQYKPLADDYIFFGQRLTYDNATHESLPNRINKVDNAIDRTENSDRVYRASAYYMNSTESDIFFNTKANFVDTYDSKPIHHNLTAIDFTGSKADMEQLLGFSLGDGLTKNLLVYAEDVPNNPTYGNVSIVLNETALSISSISDNNYKTVAKNTSPSRGHLVTKQSNNYVALTDHFLVDRENFNVPIKYSFDSGKRMWYQREPDRFAVAGNGNGDGWDIICLPFTANLVTTHQKGEITHFYGDSKKMHEYWLRELKEVYTTTSDDQTSTIATFASPAAVENNSYTRYNDFLSDYYYSKYDDKNDDTYQDYYKNSETFAGYAYLKANTPYIIAFPGQSYHEFDMSGNFVPEHTATSIGRLDKQVVTFVSTAGATIGVTDDATLVKAAGGYNFVGTYQIKDIKDINGYLINAAGSAFVKANDQSSVPFRGYIEPTSRGNAPKRIVITGAAEEEEEPAEDVIERGLTIYSKDGAIYVESTLEHETTLTIHTMSGQVVKRITLQPMSKEVIPVTSRGIYIVNNKKVSIL